MSASATSRISSARSAAVETRTQQWQKVFPKCLNDLKSDKGFVSKLVAVGVSTICYLRTNIDDAAFRVVMLGSTKLQMLKRNSGCSVADLVMDQVRSAMKALEKGYLRELTLAFYLDEDDPEDVFEAYTFNFDEAGGDDDGPDGGAAPIDSRSELYRTTRRMLKSLILRTQGLEQLPDTAFLAFRLGYFDEKTPPDYEPTGFQAANGRFRFGRVPLLEPKEHILGNVRSRRFGTGVRLQSLAPVNEEVHLGDVTMSSFHMSTASSRKRLGVCLDDDDEEDDGDNCGAEVKCSRLELVISV